MLPTFYRLTHVFTHRLISRQVHRAVGIVIQSNFTRIGAISSHSVSHADNPVTKFMSDPARFIQRVTKVTLPRDKNDATSVIVTVAGA